jgi:transposase
MARPFHAEDRVEAALECIKTTKSAVQLRRAQAVVLPLRYGLDLDQTAEVVGLSKGWVSRMRNQFIAVAEELLPTQGGRRRQSFSREREAELLKPFLELAQRGGVLVVSQIKPELEKVLGRKMALATAYNILHRNGWRKLAPDKHHPQSDSLAQEAFKKTAKTPRRGRQR